MLRHELVEPISSLDGTMITNINERTGWRIWTDRAALLLVGSVEGAGLGPGQ